MSRIQEDEEDGGRRTFPVKIGAKLATAGLSLLVAGVLVNAIERMYKERPSRRSQCEQDLTNRFERMRWDLLADIRKMGER